jgi:hypothetical protein
MKHVSIYFAAAVVAATNVALADAQPGPSASKAPMQPPIVAGIAINQGAVMPVVVQDKHFLIALDGWVKDAVPNQAAIRKTMTEQFSPAIVKVTSVPASLANVKGTIVVGFDAAGKPCNSVASDLWVWGLASEDQAQLLVEIVPSTKCKPWIISNQPAGITLLKAKPVSAKMTKALLAAFEVVDGYATAEDRKRFSSKPKFVEYSDGVSRWMVGTVFRKRANSDGCGNNYVQASGVFTLDSKGDVGVPVAAQLGDEKAVFFDSDHDGTLEAISAGFKHDLGMSMHEQLGAYSVFSATKFQRRAIAMSRYAGCD